MKRITAIITFDSHRARYYMSELEKYVKRLTNGEVEVVCELGGAPRDNALVLAHLDELSLDAHDLFDPVTEDIIDIDVKNGVGHIAGSNDRSILIGIYKYLKSAGCRWVRPGADGEYIPYCDLLDHSFKYRKKADYNFRGQCIEGAVSFEHVRDTVEWLPKIDMNMFMLEQIVPYNYMSRWYTHIKNTKLDHTDIPYEKYCEYSHEIEKTIDRCGLQYHALGHGALNEPFGVRHMISGGEYDIPEETKKAFALVGGKRELYKKSPFFTQFCMSQEWVQDRVVNWLYDYIVQKPYIDVLHFWLADNINNHCECEDCVKKTPTDWYVIMLNKLDKKLTENGMDTKVAFIMYTDTLWPPVTEKLNNPSRFILTTACGTGKGYSAKRREGGLPKWERNNFKVKTGIDMALTFIDAWKPVFDGQKFIYEYYLYTSHFSDPGYMAFSRVIAKDIKTLEVTGFDGIMSDQTQRSYFPTALPSSLMGHMLFDTSLDTETFIDDYFKSAFGNEWMTAKEYLEKISASFDLEAMMQNTDSTAQDTGSHDTNSLAAGVIGNTAVGDVIAKVPDIVEDYADAVKRNLTLKNECHRLSWKMLEYHGEYCKGVSEIYYLLSRNDTDGATRSLDKFIDYLSEIEMEIHRFFDLVLFIQRTKQIINGK